MHRRYSNSTKSVQTVLLLLCIWKLHHVSEATEIISVKFKSLPNGEKEYFDSLANIIAAKFSLINLGQIGELKAHYSFKQKHKINDLQQLTNHNTVEWHKKETPLIRVKRNVLQDWKNFQDPLLNKQWHLNNLKGGFDCNVTGVWSNNITGKGIVVAIVDDGVEWKHPDLIDNYCKEGSFDINSDDDDPSPVHDEEDKNKHGTRCAGEVAAVPNSICGIGIAYGSKFSGIRAIDGPTTDAREAVAFNKLMDVNDVYSCSWGPEDSGNVVDGPHELGKAALEHGVMAGRRGFGSIFVVASGNGGIEKSDDNCNFDGYANSIYTITIAAINEYGKVPDYSESCTSMLATTVSSGGFGRDIVTTDWNNQCAEDFSGTSAATPLVAGMVALMLEARPCLTWRDVQHIFAMTAINKWKEKSFGRNDWVINKMGFHHSDTHGFGLLDSWKLVNAAKIWTTVPYLVSLKLTSNTSTKINIGKKNALVITREVSQELAAQHLLNSLEYILLEVSIKHPHRGKLSFEIECPPTSNEKGTTSVIPGRKKDNSTDGFSKWVFSTVKCWGEKPHGKYKIRIIDKRNPSKEGELGSLESWSLTLYGSQLTQNVINSTRELLKNAYSGKYISSESNFTVECPSGIALEFDVTTAIQERTLKLLIMISAFLLFWALYYSIEMTFCNPEDKPKAAAENLSTNTNNNNETSETTQPTNGNYGGVSTINNLFSNPVFSAIDSSDTAPIILDNDDFEVVDTPPILEVDNIVSNEALVNTPPILVVKNDANEALPNN